MISRRSPACRQAGQRIDDDNKAVVAQRIEQSRPKGKIGVQFLSMAQLDYLV